LCVCKKIIMHCQNMKTRKVIRDKIADAAVSLVQNPFGNYVMQVVIEV
jgi:hypothetical protein